MIRKLAIDWDEIELRLVAAQCGGGGVKVTDAAVIPIENSNIVETLRKAIELRGLEHTETLVAIGRGMAELRELQLPTVPDEELPDMVRFQAIRSFASAGDSATVDYLVTERSDSGIALIAAAVGPDKLNEIRKTCEAAELSIERVSLRPLSAAALYLIHHDDSTGNDTVLIDLLANDAEIVITRQGRVIFVRTVRMPSTEAARGKALAGELRRSLVACGSTGSLERVVLWGRKSVHADDIKMLAEASGSPVDVLDPFDVIGTDAELKSSLPEHVGRLAPLVGLLAADESAPDRLVDFLNPRQRIEETPSPYRTGLLVGIPIAVVLLLSFLVYNQLKGLDQEIAELKAANEAMKPTVDAAKKSIGRTDEIDKVLDGDVNWLSEIRRLANKMPPSDKLIVESIRGAIDTTVGGGDLNIVCVVTEPDVIEKLEEQLRDESHSVVGGTAKDLDTEDGYGWQIDESITISSESIRNQRYEALTALATAAAQPAPETPEPASSESPPETESPPKSDSPPDIESPADTESEPEPADDSRLKSADLAADQAKEARS